MTITRSSVQVTESTVKPAILEVRDLTVHYHTSRGAVQAVNAVSFDIREGERLGLVGESGSGKSTIAVHASSWSPETFARLEKIR